MRARALRIVVGLAAAFAAAAPPLSLAGPKAEPISKLEVRALPQRLATQIVLRQVADLLRPDSRLTPDDRHETLAEILRIVADDPDTVTAQAVADADEGAIDAALARLAGLTVFTPDPAAGPHPRNSLREYTLERPYRATAYAGLCVVDDVTVMFGPTGTVEGAATAVRASDVDIRHYYHRLLPPPAPQAPGKARDAATARDCAKLDFHGDHRFFAAANAADAVQGLWLADAVQAAARGGGTAFPVTCPQKDACLPRLADPREGLVGASGCAPAAAGGQVCTVDFGDYSIAVTLGGDGRIAGAVAHEEFIIADMRAD